MPRPSLERTLKYIPVVPRAQSKLGREARRGSHDLRKLVGHANFLDTLMDSLDLGSVEEEVSAQPEPQNSESNKRSTEDDYDNEVPQSVSWSKVDFGNDAEWETDDGSSSSGSDDDEELITPDDEDDEEHALGRTVSYRHHAGVETLPIVTPMAEHPTSVTSAAEVDDDETPLAAKDSKITVVELQDKAEDYFSDKNLPHERAQVTASLASFDVGTTLSAVGSAA